MSSPSVPRKKVRSVQGWREIRPRTRWATAEVLPIGGKRKVSGKTTRGPCQNQVRYALTPVEDQKRDSRVVNPKKATKMAAVYSWMLYP